MDRGRKPQEGVEKLSAGIMVFVTPSTKKRLIEEAEQAGHTTLAGYIRTLLGDRENLRHKKGGET